MCVDVGDNMVNVILEELKSNNKTKWLGSLQSEDALWEILGKMMPEYTHNKNLRIDKSGNLNVYAKCSIMTYGLTSFSLTLNDYAVKPTSNDEEGLLTNTLRKNLFETFGEEYKKECECYDRRIQEKKLEIEKHKAIIKILEQDIQQM